MAMGCGWLSSMCGWRGMGVQRGWLVESVGSLCANKYLMMFSNATKYM